jgi:hypothetical protein
LQDFKRSGALEENWDALGKASQEGQTLGAAIAVRVTIPPGEHRQVRHTPHTHTHTHTPHT